MVAGLPGELSTSLGLCIAQGQKEVRAMGSWWFFCQKLVLVSALLLASVSWYGEVLAQSASLLLNWTDTSNNEDGFKIERLVAGLVDGILSVPASATTYTDSALVAGTVYCYRVQAFNSAGDSEPSNQACAMAEGPIPNASANVNLSANPTIAAAGSTLTANWSGIAIPTTTDWIGLYQSGAADTNFIKWIYVSCSTTPGAARSSGSCSFTTPSKLSTGSYELRLLANDGFSRLAATKGLTVTTGAPPTLTLNPTTVRVGATVTTNWSGITPASPKDWIGLYAPGAADTQFINWIYVSCSTVAGTARASGSCSYLVPATLSAGNYELRLFANDGFTRLASKGFTVTVGATTSPTLTVDPKTVKAGSTVTAAWSGIATPAPKDWIGLYTPGAVDTKFISWIYVSCSKKAGTARASGSCSYTLPATLAAGNYELRLFANDGFTRLATSNPLTVSTSSTATPLVLANAVSTTNGSITDLPVQTSREWTDYDLKVNLRSLNTNSIGVMFRYQDDRNYYRFIWNQKSKFRHLEKIQNGTTTVLAKDVVGYVKGRTYQVQITAQGAALRVFIDGAQIFSVADSTFAEGTVGLYSSNNQASFDNIVVQDLATSAVLLSEDFDDGSFTGWTIVDEGKRQGPSTWSATTGTLLQTSNIDGTFALYVARGWTDYRLTAKLQSLDNGAMGVMFRYQGSNNYYRFSWDARRALRALEKVQNGALTVLAKDTVPYVMGTTYNLEITAKGSALDVLINGLNVFSVIDSSLPKGTVALYSSYNKGSSFDEVLVQDVATGVVLLSDDFGDGAFNGWTIVDEGTDQKPSAWSIKTGTFVQTSNIGSNGTNNLGTYALY
jgi:Domain of Unknown Function (DUF1080)